jgi:hypothetical protein
MALGGPNRSGDAVGDGLFEESPKGAGGEAQPSDFLDKPDAECASAALTSMAVAAKDSPGTECFLLGAAVVKSAKCAMLNEVADGLAMGASREFEALGYRDPILLVAVEPPLVVHVRPWPRRERL